jgi:S1-C subfamily serine protease
VVKQDYYALLGVSREVEAQAIEQACASALLVTSDSAKRVRLRHARDILCNPARRAAYDRSLRTIPTSPRGLGGPSTPPRSVAAHKTSVTSQASPVQQRWLWVGGLTALALVAAGLGYTYVVAKPKPAARAAVEVTAPGPGKPPAPHPKATSAGTTTTSASVDPAGVYATAAPSVLLIESLNTSGAVGSRGSAVVVGPELVVTNCHLVQYASAVRVRSGSQEYTAQPDTADTSLNLCVLRVPGLNAPSALRSSIQQVRAGQTVFVIGATQDPERQRALSQGQVTALREVDGTMTIQISATMAPASSGGGLFDAEGRLIGIATQQHKLGPNQNLAMPVDLLNQLRNR